MSVNRVATKLAVGVTTATAFYVIYDYQTAHPMRKMQGYNYRYGMIRLYNAVLKQTLSSSAASVLPLPTTMTLAELAHFDGTNGNPTYFASEGYIWDASASNAFADSYSQFKGKDASMALAKMSMDAKDVNRTDWNSLSQQDINVLQSWTNYFEQKYYMTGRLQEYDEYLLQQQGGK
jgi:predicted heme/steroid binding protein